MCFIPELLEEHKFWGSLLKECGGGAARSEYFFLSLGNGCKLREFSTCERDE
jgi:hypothetical protein